MFKLFGRFIPALTLSIFLFSCGGDEPETYFTASGSSNFNSNNSIASNSDSNDPTDILTLEKEIHKFAGIAKLFIPDAGPTNIAYISAYDIVGDNPNNAYQLFTHRGNVVKQVTSFTETLPQDVFVYSNAVMSGDGSTVAFMSKANITGSNADLGQEIFLVDTPSGTITQLTNNTLTANEWFQYTGPGTCMNITSDASMIYFISDGNYGGGSPASTWQLFSIPTDGTNTISRVTSVAVGTGITSARLSKNDNRFITASRYDLLGTDSDGSGEYYYFDKDGTNLTQITHISDTNTSHETTRGGFMNDDGTIIAFASGRDLENVGNFENELYTYNTITDTMTKLTQNENSSNVQYYASSKGAPFTLSGNGEYIFYNQIAPHNGILDYGVMRSTLDGATINFLFPSGIIPSSTTRDSISYMQSTRLGDKVTFLYQGNIYSIRP